ncbi:DUF481 domain-containing protein [Sulfurimonas paralvinellae]|uniref:DUF481 domain-containing protein n=1 Tax=Sulfurimonas paralvinellae TaxID=317658 RepID=A0A7M1BA78_9BACT|nr:DUF481 domain-containing protein [Sulfurimonas paralvinellae]QOP45738.1 DUF481 domain-containing protein [Sulfurimonas paralvinellae]
MRLLLLALMAWSSAYAVVTIAPVDIGAKPGFSGLLKGSLETSRGNTDTDSYAAGLRFQYDNNQTYVLWSDFVFNYGKSSGKVNTNKTYSHVRYIHTLYKKSFDWEAFGQSQTDEFTKVEHRYLVGAGIRVNWNKKLYGKFYAGFGAFFEDIDYTTSIDPHENNMRFNSYVAYTKNFTKETKISDTFYYQPKSDDISDYIISNGLELNILIYKELYINFLLLYNYDNEPAYGVEKEDISQKTSFIYKF